MPRPVAEEVGAAGVDFATAGVADQAMLVEVVEQQQRRRQRQQGQGDSEVPWRRQVQRQTSWYAKAKSGKERVEMRAIQHKQAEACLDM